MRNLYLKMIEHANTQYSISSFNSECYLQFFGRNEKLESILQRKLSAINAKEYELAAELRDNEKSVIISLLAEFGVDSSAKFFVKDERIYKIW